MMVNFAPLISAATRLPLSTGLSRSCSPQITSVGQVGVRSDGRRGQRDLPQGRHKADRGGLRVRDKLRREQLLVGDRAFQAVDVNRPAGECILMTGLLRTGRRIKGRSAARRIE